MLVLIAQMVSAFSQSTPQFVRITGSEDPSGVNGIYEKHGTTGSLNWPYWKHESQNYYIYSDYYSPDAGWFWNIDDNLEDEVDDVYFFSDGDYRDLSYFQTNYYSPHLVINWVPFLGTESGEVQVEEYIAYPEINIIGNSNSIMDGDSNPSLLDHTDFGSVNITNASLTRTFTIENIDRGTLNLTGSPVVEIIGASEYKASYRITRSPLTTLNQSESTTFNITFNPDRVGDIPVTVSIANNDSDENPYTFAIQGTGISTPTLTTLSATTITTSSATLGGEISSDGGSSLSGRGIVYSLTDATPTIGEDGVIQVTSSSEDTNFSEVIGSLAIGTSYYYQAYAINSQGTSYGGVETFTTQNSVISLVRSGASPTNASSVTWNITFSAPLSGLASSHFSLANTGLAEPSISEVSGSGSDWTITASTGTGSGTLALNLVSDEGLSHSLSNLPFSGEVYTISDDHYWTGNISSDWNTAGNWSVGSLPGSTNNVIIQDRDNDPVISSEGSANCNNLTIEAGGSLLIRSDASGTGSLIISGTSTGALTVERWLTANEWHIVGPPVSGQTVNALLTNPSNSIALKNGDYGVASYNEAANNWNPFFTSATAGTFQSGSGYLFRRQTNSGTVSFTGTPVVTNMEVSLLNEGSRWNGVANPFTSAIGINNNATSAENFLTVNSTVLDDNYEAIYIWDPLSQDYVIISHSGFSNATGKATWASDYLQSGQGFIVRKTSGESGLKSESTNQLRFTTGMRIHKTDQVFKSDHESWPGIILSASLNGSLASTAITFHEQMTPGLDPGYDAGAMKNNPEINIFTKLPEDNGVDFGLQCLPLESLRETSIPIGITSASSEVVQMRVELTGMEQHRIILEDKKDRVIYLLDNDQFIYSFLHHKNDPVYGRFYLHFGQTTSVETMNNEPSRVWYHEGRLFVNGLTNPNSMLIIYDLHGRILAEHRLMGESSVEISVPSLQRGLYIVQIFSKTSRQAFKITVN